MLSISITLRKLDFGNSIKANADVLLEFDEGEVTIKGLKVIHQNGKPAWVAMPSNSYKDRSGEFKNFQIVEFSRKLKERICTEVLEKYKTLQ